MISHKSGFLIKRYEVLIPFFTELTQAPKSISSEKRIGTLLSMISLSCKTLLNIDV